MIDYKLIEGRITKSTVTILLSVVNITLSLPSVPFTATCQGRMLERVVHVRDNLGFSLPDSETIDRQLKPDSGYEY